MLRDSLVVTGGRVLTMEPERPTAEAVVVRDGRIVLVGTAEEARAAAPDLPVFDCDGRTVVPGFIDGHAHFEMTCAALTHCVPCASPAYGSLAEIAAALRERAASVPPGRWVIGRASFGLQGKVAEGRLFTRQELDAITQDHPLVVFSGFHVGMLNTRAFQELGLWGNAEPPRGVTLHRDESGVPTGVATEIWDMLPPFSTEEVKEAIRARATDLFLANGVTTIHTIPYATEDVRADQELQAAGELPLRLRLYYHVPHLLSLECLLATGFAPGFGDEMLRFGGVKIFVDGTGHDGFGNRLWDVKWTQEELTEFVSTAHAGGVQLWMHINAMPSVRMAAAALEEALRRYPAPHRHRLEHGADFLDGEEGEMRRLRDLGVGLVTSPQFIYSQGDTVSDRFPKPVRLRTLVDHGFPVIGSSDATGTVPDGNAPLFNIGCAVTRRTQRGRIDRPEERVTVEEALKMFTIWAARGAFEEHEKGSIAVGKLGDFAVLADDPLAIDPEELSRLPVDATIIGGRVVYRR